MNPIIPPGNVAKTIYQNILPSCVFSFLTTWLNPPFIRFTQSLKKNIPIAKSVPKCKATSKESGMFQLKIHGIKFIPPCGICIFPCPGSRTSAACPPSSCLCTRLFPDAGKPLPGTVAPVHADKLRPALPDPPVPS